MCGIFGTTLNYNQSVLNFKLNKMHHRGPDFSATMKVTDTLTFGHNRLAIIDLDPRSNQPFTYQGVTIVFNGEIFNFLDLKILLENDGYEFETTSDTEVLCASYLKFGTKCVDHLNGMFSFVIYDESKNILFGARDRLGKKPFYYLLDNDKFEFASSLSSIEFGNNFELDNEALIKYLYWNYIPEPHTPYQNVYKLPAAHSFTFNIITKEFIKFKYWDIPEISQPQEYNYNSSVKKLDELLTEAVKIRMISDVPLGVFLSGGVDSSVIAAIAQKLSQNPIKTFSIKFDEVKFDESAYAKQVSDILKTDHSEIRCTYEEGIDFIINFSDYYDEPFADSSAIPSLLLSKYTSKNVTVALSGDGGDETFLGYNIYDIIQKRNKLFLIPYTIRLLISKLIDFFAFNNIRLNLISKGLLLKNIKSFYLSYFKGLNKKWIRSDEKSVEYLEYLLNKNKNLLESISDFDTKTYMNGDCITKVERASMAFSLEVRSPLMDYKIIEFTRTIPTNYKYFNGIKKRMLKDVLYKYLPKIIFDRKKTGFGMPLGIWFRTVLKSYVEETFNHENLLLVDKIIVRSEFLKIVDEHMTEKWDHTPKIWKMIVLINWLKKRDLIIE